MCFVVILAAAVLATEARAIVVAGRAGRFNNVLIFFSKALLKAKDTDSVLLFSANLKLWTGDEGSLFDIFNFSVVIRLFPVIFLDSKDYELERDECCATEQYGQCLCLTASDAFYSQYQVKTVLQHLRPSDRMSRLLAELPMFDHASLLRPRIVIPYAVVHLRWLEGTCIERIMRSGTRDDAEKICHMPVEDVNRWRSSVGLESAPLIVVSDNQQPQDLQNLIDSGALYFGSLFVSTPVTAIGVDFWLLVYANKMLGNAASTFSLNACHIRQAMNFTQCTLEL